MSTQLVTPIFRAAFVHLLEPRANQNGTLCYEVTMIFDPSEVDINPLIQAYNAAVKEKWGDAPPKTGVKSPLRKGVWKSQDYPRGFDLERYPFYEGMLVCPARSYTERVGDGVDTSKRPGIVGPDPAAMFDPHNNPNHRLYSGMYGRAEVKFYVPKARPGVEDQVAVSLQNFQKCYDGEAISGGRSKAEEVFGSFESPATQANNADLLEGV